MLTCSALLSDRLNRCTQTIAASLLMRRNLLISVICLSPLSASPLGLGGEIQGLLVFVLIISDKIKETGK